MNRAERRRLRRNPAARAIAARRREEKARRLIEAREKAGLGPEVYESLSDEAKEYILALEQRAGGGVR